MRATRIAGSDVFAAPRRRQFTLRKFVFWDRMNAAFFAVTHFGALLAPFTYTPAALRCFLLTNLVCGLVGITFCYHRLLSHRSFAVPWPVEYCAAVCGLLACQGGPVEWVSHHRHHHAGCDTPADPHSPYEGLWHAHAGWLLDWDATVARAGDRRNAADLAAQPFYAHLDEHHMWYILLSMVVLFGLGGLPYLVWGFFLRVTFAFHYTWAVNSLAHVYGVQAYRTGDLSRNLAPLCLVTWGDSWHHNHQLRARTGMTGAHCCVAATNARARPACSAFAWSARHGLEWWQADPTWWLIRALELAGVATRVQQPSAAQKAKLAL